MEMSSFVAEHRLELGVLQLLECSAAHHDGTPARRDAIDDRHRMLQNAHIVQITGEPYNELEGLPVSTTVLERTSISRYRYAPCDERCTQQNGVKHIRYGADSPVMVRPATRQPLGRAVSQATPPCRH
jgi:hypothetical protein